MIRMHRLLVAVVVSLSAHVASAAELAPQVRAEVERLLGALGSSGCEFNRNGTWYNAVEAQAHLRKKYDYLLKKEMISTTEEFIDKGGSESSRSGEAYQVRCPGTPSQSSATWLRTTLTRLRAEMKP